MRILAIHYWDTRPRIVAPYWLHNLVLVRNTFEVMNRNLPTDWSIDHHIMLHEIVDAPRVRDLAQQMGTLHAHQPVMSHGMSFFNGVALSSYEILADYFGQCDMVFCMQQDRFLINHYDTNLIVLMSQMMEGSYPDLAHHQPPVPYDYISHTIPACPAWSRWHHNAAGDMGLWKVEKLPLIKESRYSDKAGEVHLGRAMGEQCLYMKLNPWIYLGDYCMDHLTATRVEFLMGFTQDQRKMAQLMAVCEQQWCASLHPFWEEVA